MTTFNNKNSQELKTSVIGVDLGSSFTKIAAVQKGVVDIITNQANLRQTPTIVGYGNNERLIGESGNVKIQSNLNNTIIAPHRYMGVKSQEYLKQQGSSSSNQLRHQEYQCFWKVNCQGQQTRITPQQATAAFFTKVQQIVELNNINNQFLTVSIPNYLTHQQKTALLDSLQIAKRSGKHQYGVQLVNQSTAVGLDYGFYKKSDFPQKEQQAKNIIFIDFGHSKLSLYVIKFTKNYQKVVYQKYLRQFGCKNLDKVMLNFYSQLFERANPNLQISVKQSKKATMKLLQNIEKQRKILSGNSEYDFSIECLLQDCDISYTMKREQFDLIISPLVNQLKQFFTEVSQSIKQIGIDISAIELIGGGSRIPIFIKAVSESFGIQPSRTLNSGQCIARGAGLYSAMNSGLFRMNHYYSIEQSPETIICSWKGQGEQIQNQSNQVVLLTENQPIYSKKFIELSLPEGTPANLLFCLTSKNMVCYDKSICQFRLNFSSSVERRIKINFQFDSNNMVKNITAFEINEKQIPLNILQFKFCLNLNEKKIEQFQRIQREQRLKDISILKYYEERNSFESQLYQIKDKLSCSLSNKEIKEFINPQSYNHLIQYFQQIEDKLPQISHFQEQLKQINNTVRQFFRNVEQTKKKYCNVQAELNKFIIFINNITNNRKRQYAKEQIDEAKRWIEQVQGQQKNRNKYEQHVTSPQEINAKLQALKQTIIKLQEEQQSEKQNNSYYQPQRNYDQRQYRQSNPLNPFATTYRQHPQGRGRNNSFNGYNSGFFSGFPSFF